MTTIARLGLVVDSSGAVSSFEQFSASAKKAESAADALSSASSGIGANSKSAATALENLASKQATANQTLKTAAISAGQYNQALRQLPIQINQAVAGLLTGQNAFQVLIQQGHQVVDSFGGARTAIRGVASALGPLGLAIGAVATVAAGITAVFYKGQQQAFELSKAIALSGNTAGVTSSQLSSMADAVTKLTNASRGDAVKAISEAVATNTIPKDLLERVSAVALQLQRTTGKAVEDTINEFASLNGTPSDAVDKLQQKYNFLTASIEEQIRVLKQSGDTTAAAALEQSAFLENQQGSATKLAGDVGFISKAWQSVKDAISGATGAVSNFGKVQSLQDQLDALNKQANGRPIGTLVPGFNTTDQLLNDRARTILQQQIAAENQDADSKQRQAQASQQYAAGLALANTALETSISLQTQLNSSSLENVANAFQALQQQVQTQADLLDRQHEQNLMSDQQYYAAKANLILQSGDLQAQEITKENQLLQRQIDQIVDQAQRAKALAGNGPASLQIDNAAQVQIATVQQQINANSARLNASIEQTARDAGQNSLDAAKAVTSVSLAYKQLNADVARYIDSLKEEQQLSLSGIGAGQNARDQAAQIAETTARFRQQIQQLDDQHARNPNLADFDKSRATLQKGLSDALASYDQYYKDLQAKQGNWLNGAREALNNYVDAAKNVANLADQAFTNAFQSMEDAIVNFATTGKFSFKDLANSILADLVRMEVKILESQALQSIFASFLGGGGPDTGLASSQSVAAADAISGARAGGGGVSAGSTYLVGEKVPELFVPSQGGTIVPNGKFGGGPSINMVANYSFGPGSDVASVRAYVDRSMAQTKADIYDSISRGQWNPAFRRGRI